MGCMIELCVSNTSSWICLAWPKYAFCLVGAPVRHGSSPLKQRREQQAQYGRTKQSRDPKRISSHGTTRHEGRAPDRNMDFFPTTRKRSSRKTSMRRAKKKAHQANETEDGSPPPRKRLRVGRAPIEDITEHSESSSDSSDETPKTPTKNTVVRTREAQDAYDNMSPSKNFEREAALSVVDIAKHKQLPSYPWRANSCWLDASLEVLYTTLNYGDWKTFQLLFDEDVDRMPLSLMYYFFLTMKGRRTWPISDFLGQNTPAQELLDLHDGFRAFLYKMKIVSGHEDTYQDGLVCQSKTHIYS